MAWIAGHYYPQGYDTDAMLLGHFTREACVHLALRQDQVVGFSINSCASTLTPFHGKEIPLFYQAALYVAPEFQHHSVGIHLQLAGLRYHLGPFWTFRRFAVVCLTCNPLILRAFSMYNDYYPRHDREVPPRIHAFCQQLAPMMGFTRIDRGLVARGTNESILEGTDCTLEWEQFLRSGHDIYDQMILNTVFSTEHNKIIHTGALLLAVGYAKPLHFVRRFFEMRWRYRQ
jgi:hypothetical protein